MREQLRNLSKEEYPLEVIDLDDEELNSIIINDKERLEKWLCDDFE